MLGLFIFNHPVLYKVAKLVVYSYNSCIISVIKLIHFKFQPLGNDSCGSLVTKNSNANNI